MSHARIVQTHTRGWLRTIRRRLTDVPFASLVAVIGINGAVTLFVQPDRSIPHHLQPLLAYSWAALYGIGGVLILCGVATARANWEAAGCAMFAGGALINAIATGAVRGLAAWNSIAVLILFALAALIRTRHLVQGRVLVLIAVPPPEHAVDRVQRR